MTPSCGKQALLFLRHLLHVVAFASSRRLNVIDADAIRGRCQRTGEGLHGARANRSDDRRKLSVLPAQCSGRVRHLDFIAAIDGAGCALLLIEAQHIAEIGRAVTEDGEVFAHALPQQAQHQCFRQRALDELRQTGSQGCSRPPDLATARARSRTSESGSDFFASSITRLS